MNAIDTRRIQLKMLWQTNRAEFLAMYRRVTGESPGRDSKMSMASMIDRIIEREASAGRLGG